MRVQPLLSIFFTRFLLLCLSFLASKFTNTKLRYLGVLNVRSIEEGFGGSWHCATITSNTRNPNSKYCSYNYIFLQTLRFQNL
ncbi:hypothetical protein L1887_27540 [Cichorium endivia]|nr:hypothetical protein L1887_27540 [Cichorium endivia]